MAVNNTYPNLPGHLVEFKDGGLQFISSGDEDQVGGKSILILGTAFDGQINNPIKVSESNVNLVFGSELDENGRISKATITKAAKQAFRNGFTDVRCMRVTGTVASALVKKKVPSDPATSAETGSSAPITFTTNEENARFSLNTSNVPHVTSDNVPFYGDTNISCQLLDGTDITGSLTVEPWTGECKIQAANMFKRGTQAVFNYKYISSEITDVTVDEINDAPIVVTAEDGTFAPIVIENALDAGTTIYATSYTDNAAEPYPEAAVTIGHVTPKNKKRNASSTVLDCSDGIIVKKDGTTILESGVDYSVSVSNGSIVIIPLATGSLAVDDVLTVDYYVANIASAEENITIVDSPASGYTIDLHELFPEGNDYINSAITSIVVTHNGESTTLADDGYTFTDTPDAESVNIMASVVNTIEPNSTIVVNIAYDKNLWDEYEITFRTKNGGKAYNNAILEVKSITDNDGNEGRQFLLTKPEGKNASNVDKVLEYSSFDYPTVDLLALGLDNDILNNDMFEMIYEDGEVETGIIDPGIYTFSGATDGVNITEKELYQALSGIRDSYGYLIQQGAYQILENYNVDYLYPAGAYADSSLDFHYQLALVAAALTYRTKMTHGLIDVKPCSNRSLVGIQTYVDKLIRWSEAHNPMYMLDNDGNPFADQDGNKREIGWYTSVVVGPEPIMSSSTLGTYYGSPAIAYGALNANIPAQSAPTLKPISGANGMKFGFSNKQQNELIGARFVIFKTKNENSSVTTSRPYVIDGCTFGQESCDYARMSTVKVVTDVVDQVREVCEPFLGEPNTIEQRNAMSALISKRLSYLMESGEILHFEFEVLSTIQQMLLGECQISLTLVAPTELRKITTVVALRPAA